MFDLRETIYKALHSYPADRDGNLRDLTEYLAGELANAFAPTLADVERYRWLRDRDLETIDKGGVFAGMTPKNVVLNGADLDNAIDAAMVAS